MKVLIVGAGIAGLALAKFLEKKADVLVIERSKNWKNIGFVLTLFPNGVQMLKKLGAESRLEKLTLKIPGTQVRGNNGETICEIRFKELEKRYAPVLEIEREDLHNLMRTLNRRTKIKMNTTIKDVKETQEGIEVTFNTGRKKNFDIVVGADGINSQLRKYIHPRTKKDYSGFTFWYAWCPKVFKFPKDTITYLGDGKVVGVFPTKNKNHAAIYFTMPAHQHQFEENWKNVDFLKRYFKDMGGDIPKILESLPEQDPTIYHHDDEEIHTYHWYKGRLVLIGDAAHALSPSLGMGASMALEDAYVLAEEISKKEIPKAFKNYAQRRYPRVEFLARKSREIHLLMGIGFPLCRIRNILMKRIFFPKYLGMVTKLAKEDI